MYHDRLRKNENVPRNDAFNTYLYPRESPRSRFPRLASRLVTSRNIQDKEASLTLVRDQATDQLKLNF